MNDFREIRSLTKNATPHVSALEINSENSDVRLVNYQKDMT